VLQDTPRPVNELRTDVPPALARIIARCLEKDPAQRYANVAELAHELEPFGSQRGVSLRIAQVAGSRGVVLNPRSTGKVAAAGATDVAWEDTQLSPPPTRRRTGVAVTAAVLLLVVVAGGAVAVGYRAGHSSAATTPALEVTPTVRQIDLAAVAPSVPPAVPPATPPLPSATVAPAASVQAAAPPLAAAQPAASSPPVASPKPPTHSHSPASAKPANPKPANPGNAKRSGDDFPDERN
jgi:hypothetical protein